MKKSVYFLTVIIVLIPLKLFAETLLFISNNSETNLKLIGQVQVTDGDTIRQGKLKIRLHGIDAPELKQICKKPYLTIFMFTFYEDYSCGQISTEALIKKINNQKITCKISDIDYFKRLIGECYKRKTNLNAWLVSYGHAVAFRKYSKKYVPEEMLAKKDKKGMWRGKFEMPWDYRKSKKN